MATITVDIRALTGSFETDLRRLEKQALSSFGGMQRAGKLLGTALVSGLTVAGVSLVALTKQSIAAADEISKTAQKVGISTESLSGLSYAAKLADVNLQTLQSGMLQLTKRASEAARGNVEFGATFKALGVEVKNADGTLRSTDQLLADVADRFKSLPEGAERSRLALDLFGRSGANLIPLLKDGRDGLKDAADEAQRFGLILSTETARKAEEFNDNLTRLQSAATGLGMQVAANLLPHLEELSRDFVDIVRDGSAAREVASLVADGFKEIGFAAQFAAGLLGDMREKAEWLLGHAAEVSEVASGLNPATATAGWLARAHARARAEWDDATQSGSADMSRLGPGLADNQVVKNLISLLPEASKRAIELKKAQDQAVAGTLALVDAMGKEGNTTEDLMARLKEYFSERQAATEAQSKATEATREHERALREMQQAQDEAVEETLRMVEALDRETEAHEQQQNYFDEQAQDIQNEIMLLGLSTAERERAVIALEAERLARDQNGVTIESQRERYEALLTTLQQAQKIEAAAREFESIWTNAAEGVGDALTTALFDGAESGADAIKDVMENLARDLVRFWLQQNIVIPLREQLMGGAGGGQGMAGMFAGGAGGMGGMNLGSIAGYGQQAAWLFGGNGATGTIGSRLGAMFSNAPAASLGGGPPSNLAGAGAGAAGNAIPILAAAYGAWNVYNIGRNGPGGGRGAVSGAAAGASAGAALGSIVPVIGTAIGAVIGGILGGLVGGFGGGDPTIRVSDRERDATATSRLDEVIGVARDRMEPGTATAFANGIAEFDNAIASVLDGYRGGAAQMEEIQAVLENWSIRVEGDAATIENVLTQRFGDILATFDQDVQDFVRNAGTLEEQVQALGEVLVWPEKIADVLNAFRDAEMLAGMSELERQTLAINEQFDQLRVDFEAMNATTEDLAELERFRTLALGELTAATEANTAAIQFAIDAALDYAATVGDINRQLAELGGASEFQLTLQDIAVALNTNVARLNETAQAAGLLSAREEDLGRAHLLAAAQAARARAQLEEAGRALASDLYGSALGDIDAEIARIEAESSGASSAIGSFGDAMRDVAETANRATDLLLGDLSPLRDRQKLPIALQAFQEGKIQAEQVLQIGRRLFASGQDYNQLFDQVLAIERTRGGSGSQSFGGGGNFSGSSQSDSRLEALLARRAEIEAAQAEAARFAQASDLAQIVADLAGARGEDFGTVLGSLSGGRATLEQFAADLGLDNLEALNEYLTALQADSYGIADIAATITAGDRYIVDALREIFDYQQLREAKPDSVTDLFTKPLDVPVLLPGTEGKPITVAPPTEPTPGIIDGIEGLDTRIRQVERWLEKIANHTGVSADADGKRDKRDAGAASREAGAKPRSTRSDLVKPGY